MKHAVRSILTIGLLSLSFPAYAATVVPLGSAHAWQRAEFRLDVIPAVDNPFDPDQITVDATFTDPDGAQRTLPAFYYQDYSRRLVDGREMLSPAGFPDWRVRFTPTQPGQHDLTIVITTNGQPAGVPIDFSFPVAAATGDDAVLARLGAGRRHLARADGSRLVLVGQCVCWHGNRGTYDYDDWFPAMAAAKENYARLWMAPWAFGIENPSAPLNRYSLERAWQLDYVFQLAEQHGLYLMLCLDYHGMFETEPDFWGGNNYWPQNPYNVQMGGPCATPNAFFTDPTARKIYQNRLRYLIARYAYSPRLLAWQFFNEIDNVYRYLEPSDVAAWHASLGAWLKARDPYEHLVTTSLTGGSDRSEIWRLPEMDFAMFHSYNLPNPALGLSNTTESFVRRYNKPMMIGEFGVNWQGWNEANDPYLRGLRQGLWTGLLGGSVGTAMPWWWQDLHRESVYPLFDAMADFVQSTRLGEGSWQSAPLEPPLPPPVKVGALLEGGQPFNAHLALNTQWGADLGGKLAVANPDSTAESSGALNSFVHGTAHSDLRIPFQLHLWCGDQGRLEVHLNSVSSGAILSVVVDAAEIHRQDLPNLDGTWEVNHEYDTNIIVALPPGQHLVEIRNAGLDWFYLDGVELKGVLPAEYEGGWQPAPVAIGLRGEAETLLYVAHPKLKYPALITEPSLTPVTRATVTLLQWPAGIYAARWQDARTGVFVGDTSGTATADGQLRLPVPAFSEDVVARLICRPSLLVNPTGPLSAQVQLVDPAQLEYHLESSTNLSDWTRLNRLSDDTPADIELSLPRNFYRTRLP